MTTTILTPQIIISLKEKNPDKSLLCLDDKVNKYEEKGKIQTYYLPIRINIEGKKVPMTLKFNKTPVTSGVKLPFNTPEEKAKFLQISYREITEEDLDRSDYPGSKRQELMENSKMLIKALDIIADECESLINNVVKPAIEKGDREYESLGSLEVHNFRQNLRLLAKDEKTDGLTVIKDRGGKKKVKLNAPMYRIRIKVDSMSRRLGRVERESKKFIPCIYDAKKTNQKSKSGNYAMVPAQVLTTDTLGRKILKDIDIQNAKHFLTYLSLTSGMISIESICISSQGISVLVYFRQVLVWRHKSIKTELFSSDEVNDMAGFGIDDGEDEVDIEAEEKKIKEINEKAKKKKQAVVKDVEDYDQHIEEPTENYDEEEEVETKVTKPSTKANKHLTKQPVKTIKKQTVVSDDENEDSEDVHNEHAESEEEFPEPEEPRETDDDEKPLSVKKSTQVPRTKTGANMKPKSKNK